MLKLGTTKIAGGTSTIVDALTSTSTTNALSANQGKVLNDGKANLASPTFTGTVVLPSTTSIGNVSSTELGYLDGVTSAIQTQFTNKVPWAESSSFDCNTIKDTSIRGIYNATNGPTTGLGILFTMRYSADWVVQVFFGVEGSNNYVRRFTSGTTWNSWGAL